MTKNKKQKQDWVDVYRIVIGRGYIFFYPGSHKITSGACDQIILFYLHIYNIIHAIFGKLNISCYSIYYIYKKYDMKFYL